MLYAVLVDSNLRNDERADVLINRVNEQGIYVIVMSPATLLSSLHPQEVAGGRVAVHDFSIRGTRNGATQVVDLLTMRPRPIRRMKVLPPSRWSGMLKE